MATRMNRHRKQVIYFYGLTDKLPGTLEGVAGVDGTSRVEALLCSGLQCWISRVSKSEFADELQRNMQNLDWLDGLSPSSAGCFGDCSLGGHSAGSLRNGLPE